MKYKTVTIWHKTANNSYDKTVCKRSFILSHEKASVGGSGITVNNSMTVRCFTNAKFPVSAGDKIYCDNILSAVPPENAFIIKEIKENFNCSARLKHYRFECVW